MLASALRLFVYGFIGCGVASYPAAASSAEELLEQARDLMRATTAQQPVRVANEGPPLFISSVSSKPDALER